MHLVTGGGEKQLAGMMMQAEADLDELIVAYSEVSCSQILTATLAIAMSESLPFQTMGKKQPCACLGRMPSSWSSGDWPKLYT